MIFKNPEQVLDGTKTQTRRPVKPGEVGVIRPANKPLEFASVMAGYGLRIKWQVGNDYAVQPGRGKKAVGRIRITKIRRERLQEISAADVYAEGTEQFARDWNQYIADDYRKRAWRCFKRGNLEMAFKFMWNSLYRKPYCWKDNPEVWVLEFEVAKEASDVQ